MDAMNSSGFVSVSQMIADVLLDVRYYSAFNFVGKRINGYEQPVVLLTEEAAQALVPVSAEALSMGYRLKLFDGYRPQRAVDHFALWAKDPAQTETKAFFYPDVDKRDLFRLGYIAERSGHSRGSTIDLTLFDMRTQQDVDMGGGFDFFGKRSHFAFDGLTPAQRAHRDLLQSLMTKHGFRPYAEEWWHFTLINEPYPDTYFDFPVKER